MDANQRNHLDRLLSAMIEDCLTDVEREELNFLLQDDPVNRRYYLQYMDLQAQLTRNIRAAETRPSMDWIDILETRAGIENSVSRATAEGNRAFESRKRGLRWTRVVVSLAAAVMVILMLRDGAQRHKVGDPKPAESLQHSSSMNTVKVLDSAGAELFDERLPPVGGAVQYEHEYALTAGMLALKFPCGSEAILEAPCVVEVAEPARLIVKLGKCSVHAPEGAEGFRVDTPRNQIVDLGTRFSVEVTEVGETDVQVLEGAAEVRTQDVDEPVLLTDGQARRYGGASRSGTEVLGFDPQRYRQALPDRVMSYQTLESGSNVEKLTNVIVQRGGIARDYAVGDLIGVKVMHFLRDRNPRNVAVPKGYVGSVTDTLENDALLNSGMINPGGGESPLESDPVLADQAIAEQSPTPGMAIRFDRPVYNGAGPDVVLFDLQTFSNPPGGDAFHVSPLEFHGGLHSMTVFRYDITMTSPHATTVKDFDLPVFADEGSILTRSITDETERYTPATPFRCLAVGIDLSDLGYREGVSVDGLFLQDAADDDDQVDPVFIAGLPADSKEVSP